MFYCQECGNENINDAQFCSNCGAKLIQNKTTRKSEVNNDNIPQNMEKLSTWNNLMLDFPAIGKGLLVSLLIGTVIAGFIGIFFGGMLTGYYSKNKRVKHVAINGWIVGIISIMIWVIIGIVFQLPDTLGINFTVANTISPEEIGIELLIAIILLGLIGAIGAIIGLKLSKRKNRRYSIKSGD